MKKLVKLLLVMVICVLTGCSPKELAKYSSEKCTTTLEGYYYKEKTTEFRPSIFVKTSKEPRRIKEDILVLDSTGIYTEDSVFYSYDTLYGAVNKKGKLVYGNIPNRFVAKQSLEIIIEDTVKLKKALLKLLPNEPFAYCLDPGNYIIKGITFRESNSVEDVGYDFPEISFEIVENKVNYIGNIYGDYKTSKDSNVIVIPYNRNNENGAVAAGLFGGLIGAKIYSLVNNLADEGNNHILNIESDANFLPESDKEIKKINLIIRKLD